MIKSRVNLLHCFKIVAAFIIAFCVILFLIPVSTSQQEILDGWINARQSYNNVNYGDSAVAETEPVFNMYVPETHTDRCMYMFGTKTLPQPSSSIFDTMIDITVPCWKLSSDGTKVSSTLTFTTQEKLAPYVQQIFQEIYDDHERFPINDALSWGNRPHTPSSLHNWGVALDLNVQSNPMVDYGTVVVGEAWRPGEDPLSFSADCSVVRIFKKYGFDWGGDWTGSRKDYMHFSWVGEKPGVGWYE